MTGTSFVPVIVMTYDARPQIVLAATTDRREVARALGSIEVRPIEGDAERAMAAARQLAALQTPAAIWHFSDDPGDPADGSPPADGEPDVRVTPIALAIDEPVNAGVTAFQMRRLPLQRERYTVFVQVHATAPAPLDGQLDLVVVVGLDGDLVLAPAADADRAAGVEVDLQRLAGTGLDGLGLGRGPDRQRGQQDATGHPHQVSHRSAPRASEPRS